MNDDITRFFSGEVVRITLSSPISPADGGYIRAVLKRGGKGFMLEKFTQKQVFHENLTAERAAERIDGLFGTAFANFEGESASELLSLRRAKSGRILVSRKLRASPPPEAAEADAAHDRRKNYLIPADASVPALAELGIFTAEGKVAAPMYDKFKQINRYVEFIDDIVSADPRREWNIIDFGCGKSYLTFALHHYFTAVKGLKVNMVGLDLKADVIAACSSLAEKFGCGGLSFAVGDIKDYKTREKPDMVISLHACDTATDYAIANAVAWGADYILAVLCCQHELNGQIKSQYKILTDYGLLKERFAALATDALRAKLLELYGYKCQVCEFIDLEHSPKNVLIRASKRRVPPSESAKSELSREIENFCSDFSADPALRRLLKEAL